MPRLLATPWLLAALGACAPDDEAARREHGRALLAQYQCASCHAIPDVPGGRGGVGPPLDHFGARSYIAGRWPNRPDVLQRWLVDPQALVPGTLMPDLGVSEGDARAMAAYLLSLQ